MKIAGDIKKDFPALKNMVYLDTSSSSPPPSAVIARIRDYYENSPVNAGVKVAEGIYYGATAEIVDRVTEWATSARESLAKMISANSPSEIVFTKNTSEAINVVAMGFPLKPGDEVIVTDVEHQSNIIPWLHAAKLRSATVKVVKGSADGVIDPSDVERAITGRTAIITTAYITNIFGTIQPVEAIGKIAKAHGVAYFVDGAQVGGRFPVDIQEIGCDFLSLCGRKALCGPQGISVLYGRKEALERLTPAAIGGRSARLIDLETVEYELSPVPYRFETGNNNNEGIIGLGAAVDYLMGLGMENVSERIGEMASYLYSKLESKQDVVLYGRPDHSKRTGIFSFNVRGVDGARIARRLWDLDRVLVSPGTHGSPAAMKKLGVEGTVRASLHFFTTESDLNRFSAALDLVVTETK